MGGKNLMDTYQMKGKTRQGKGRGTENNKHFRPDESPNKIPHGKQAGFQKDITEGRNGGLNTVHQARSQGEKEGRNWNKLDKK
jgi:hypothetical protein